MQLHGSGIDLNASGRGSNSSALNTGVSIGHFAMPGFLAGRLFGIPLEFPGRGNTFYFVAAMFILGLLMTIVFVRETIQKATAH